MGILDALDRFFFEGRRRADEAAWRAWVEITALRPVAMPGMWGQELAAGYVVRVYQRARRGTKALVDFGEVIGVQDTWWPESCPEVGSWISAYVHLWLPPGTHSDEPVLWVDSWESRLPARTLKRALRHQARLDRERRRTASRADAA
jgi:hypothetical protein